MPYAFHLEIATDRSVQLKRAIPRDGSCAHRERKGALRQIGVGKKTRRKRGRGEEAGWGKRKCWPTWTKNISRAKGNDSLPVLANPSSEWRVYPRKCPAYLLQESRAHKYGEAARIRSRVISRYLRIIHFDLNFRSIFG